MQDITDIEYENVTVTRSGRLATVTFDRGDSLNPFNQASILELTDVAHRFQRDLETQAVVLAGRPNAFSAGIDLKDDATWDTELNDIELRDRSYRGVRLCQAWEDMPQITVCAMEKLAVGAGVALAMACDWRVLASDAYLYVPEVKIGLNLQWGATPRLITLVGPARAKRIMLLCEKMGAEQALDWGLIEEIAEPGKSVEVATALAQAACTMPHPTTRMVKEAVNATAYALHRATSFADADQSSLTRTFAAGIEARDAFRKG